MQTLSGVNSCTGIATVSAGMLAITGRIASANVQIGASGTAQDDSASRAATAKLTVHGILALTGSETRGTPGASTLTTGLASTASTCTGAILGSGGLTRQATDTLILQGTNSPTGATMVFFGALGPSAGKTVVSAGAALEVTAAAPVAAC